MTNRSQDRRQMRMESLESRSLMAGDVMVALEGSFLRVQGDDLTNHMV
jgi:hypothetical protein